MSFGVVPEEHQRDALMAYNSAKSGLNGHAPSSSSHAMSTSTRLNATDRRDFTNAFYLENGKVYGLFKRGKYLLNYDEAEQERMDLLHKCLQIIRRDDSKNGCLHRIPLPPDPRILDLGCGTGIWAIDMADQNFHPGAPGEVIGWDLAAIQPPHIPFNTRFETRDCEDPWTGVERGYFDLIHVQLLLGSIENWPALYDKILGHLKPGGVMEQVDFDIRPCLDEGSFPENSKFLLWANELREAFKRAGKPIEMDPNTQAVLEHLGFVDVRHEAKKIAFNSWPPETQEKEMGKWFNLAFTMGLQAISYAPLSRMLGYNKDQIDALIEDVKREVCNINLKAYCILHIFTARKPATAGQRP